MGLSQTLAYKNKYKVTKDFLVLNLLYTKSGVGLLNIDLLASRF